MTSKSLFFRLMKEDLKRRLWAFGLSFLTFFFAMPVLAAMGVTNLEQQYALWMEDAGNYDFGAGNTAETEFSRRLGELAVESIGFENVVMGFLVITAALVLALTGFLYLHSRKQVDFYHSIPVRREILFTVRFVDGILVIGSMYLVNLLFTLGILGAAGASVPGMVSGALWTFLVHMTGFLLSYGLMTAAVMLTGNFFISVLGAIVLFGYVPAVAVLFQGLMQMFFVTMDLRISGIAEWIVHGSPVPYYVSLMGEGADLPMARYGELMGRILPALLAGLVLAVIAGLLYKFRPSEAAGRAMAFRMTKAPIKILLVVPVTILVCLLFWNMYYESLGWAAFGFVFALFISHGIIEILYNFDFRKLFANPVHLGISAVLALAVIGVFRYDLTGYDSYLPSEEKFQSASVFTYTLGDFQDYGLPVAAENGRQGREQGGYLWKYMDGSDYAAGNMEITDYGLVKDLAEAGIAAAEESKAIRFQNLEEPAGDDAYMARIEVGFKEKNGSLRYRYYRIDMKESMDLMERLYASAEYKKGAYPVMSFHPETTTGIYISDGNQASLVTEDPEMTAELLAAYQEELEALSLTERTEEIPVTALRFLTEAEKEYLNAISASRTQNFSGSFRLRDMDPRVNFFPVYPSFTKTMGLLKEAGAALPEELEPEDVERMEIVCHYEDSAFYKEYEEAGWEVTEEDKETSSLMIRNDGTAEAKEKIRQVLEAGKRSWFFDLNDLAPRERGFMVQVYLTPEADGTQSGEPVTMGFSPYEIPEFIRQEFSYDPEGAYQASWGLAGKKD